jgi:hypothetical protein
MRAFVTPSRSELRAANRLRPFESLEQQTVNRIAERLLSTPAQLDHGRAIRPPHGAKLRA